MPGCCIGSCASAACLPRSQAGRCLAGKLLLALLAMAAALLLVMQQLPAWADGSMLWRLLRLAGLVGVGLLAYFAVLALLGFRLRDFARRSAL